MCVHPPEPVLAFVLTQSFAKGLSDHESDHVHATNLHGLEYWIAYTYPGYV